MFFSSLLHQQLSCDLFRGNAHVPLERLNPCVENHCTKTAIRDTAGRILAPLIPAMTGETW